MRAPFGVTIGSSLSCCTESRNTLRIAHIHRVALEAFHRTGHVHAPNRRADNVLHVGDIESEAGRPLPIDVDIDIAATCHAFRVNGGRARHIGEY